MYQILPRINSLLIPKSYAQLISFVSQSLHQDVWSQDRQIFRSFSFCWVFCIPEPIIFHLQNYFSLSGSGKRSSIDSDALALRCSSSSFFVVSSFIFFYSIFFLFFYFSLAGISTRSALLFFFSSSSICFVLVLPV